MASVAASRIPKAVRPLLNWRIVVGAGVSTALIPSVLMHLVLWQTARDLDLTIVGKPWGTFALGTVDLSGARIEWKDRFTVQAEQLLLYYPPQKIFERKLPLSIKGAGVRATFGKALLPVVGKNQVTFDSVSADVMAGRRSELEIRSLEARSKEFQFHLSGEKKR